MCDREGNLASTGIRTATISENIKSLHWGPTCSEAFAITKQPRHYAKSKQQKVTHPEFSENHVEVFNSNDDSGAEHEHEHEHEQCLSRGNHANEDLFIEKEAINTGSVYEVTLHPGDVLYIPPFYFHAVVSHASSVSINTWIGSRYLVSNDALKNIDLPYRENSATVAQLSALAAMIKIIWATQNHPIGMEYFASLMYDRHQNTPFEHGDDSMACHEDVVVGPQCSGNEGKSAVDNVRQLVPCTLKSLRRAGKSCEYHSCSFIN
jgi:hypothetical protein